MTVEHDIRFVGYDFDGTLMRHPSGGHLWCNIYKKTSGGIALRDELRREHRAGRLTYERWTEITMELFRAESISQHVLHSIARELVFVPGAYEALQYVAAAGVPQALISETLDFAVEIHLKDIPFSAIHTNRMHFRSDGTIDRMELTPYREQFKADGLRTAAEAHGVSMKNVAYFGDGLNDRWALKQAGYGIAVCPEDPIVAQSAKLIVHDSRDALPFILPRGSG